MSINNETLGQSAEKVICNLSGLDTAHLANRSDQNYEEILTPLIKKALSELPKIKKHSGLEKGNRGGQSKSAIDFYLEGKQTLSVKTNKNSNMKVCPSEVGQSSWQILNIYFKEILKINNIRSLDRENFKKMVLNSIDLLIPIYLNHLMTCDYLLWIYQKKLKFNYKIIKKNNLSDFIWKFENFKFTKNMSNWNESCSIRYNEISLGEFQIHNNRSPNKKFRFNMQNLCKILNL
jgi:hypothetical protein